MDSSFARLAERRDALARALAQGGLCARVGRHLLTFEARSEMVEELHTVEHKLREAGWPDDEPEGRSLAA
jgi:hypothetical protein